MTGHLHAGWRLVKCPSCQVPPGQDCVRLDGTHGQLSQRHESRAVLGRAVKRARRPR
jgi:hypothetical protein